MSLVLMMVLDYIGEYVFKVFRDEMPQCPQLTFKWFS